MIDIGRSISMISLRALEQMQISYVEIGQDSREFDGLISGISQVLLGHIALIIVLEEEENFRRELCTFEVINFDIVYNVVKGRLHLTLFMLIPIYTYMMLKLPVPHDTIIVKGSLKRVI